MNRAQETRAVAEHEIEHRRIKLEIENVLARTERLRAAVKEIEDMVGAKPRRRPEDGHR